MITKLALLASNLCNPTDMNLFNNWGTCIKETALFGSAELLAFVILGIFLVIALKARLGAEIIVPVGTILVYAIYLGTGSYALFSLMLIGIIFSGIIIAASILRVVNRR